MKVEGVGLSLTSPVVEAVVKDCLKKEGEEGLRTEMGVEEECLMM